MLLLLLSHFKFQEISHILVLEQVNASWVDSGPKLDVGQPVSRTKKMKQIINFQCQKLKQ